MATRATVSIARREEGVSFSEKPNKTIVDIYHHYDGYPEGLGVKLASYLDDKKITNGLGNGDDYDYYVWGDDYKDIWISIFDGSECIFVGLPLQLLDKYS